VQYTQVVFKEAAATIHFDHRGAANASCVFIAMCDLLTMKFEEKKKINYKTHCAGSIAWLNSWAIVTGRFHHARLAGHSLPSR
jgi:hypothetical protein